MSSANHRPFCSVVMAWCFIMTVFLSQWCIPTWWQLFQNYLWLFGNIGNSCYDPKRQHLVCISLLIPSRSLQPQLLKTADSVATYSLLRTTIVVNFRHSDFSKYNDLAINNHICYTYIFFFAKLINWTILLHGVANKLIKILRTSVTDTIVCNQTYIRHYSWWTEQKEAIITLTNHAMTNTIIVM